MRVPDIATDSLNPSGATTGLFSVATGTVGVPLLKSYTNARPVLSASVSSSKAPTTTCVPEIATECPNQSPAAGAGSLTVRTGTVGLPLLRSYTCALPEFIAPVSSYRAPTTTRVPEIATDQ